MKTKNKQEKPKWFTGAWYKTGDIVENPFSGEFCELTGPELSMYDFIMGAQMTFEMGNTDEDVIKDFHKGLDWFAATDVTGYMKLLD